MRGIAPKSKLWSIALVLFALLTVGQAQGPGQPPAPETRGVVMLQAPTSALRPEELTPQRKDQLIQEALANSWRYAPDFSRNHLAPEAIVPAQNGQIAYVGDNGGLWLMQADGTNQRPIASSLVNVVDPAWSHDSRQLAVVADGSSGRCIYAVTLETVSVSVVTCGFVNAVMPRWSPNNSRILVFGQRAAGANWTSWIIPAGGGDPVALAPGVPQAWAPDWVNNDTVVLAGEARTDAWRLYTVRSAAPNSPSPITGEFRCSDECTCNPGGAWLAFPSSRPDGQQIAFLGGYTVGDKSGCVAYYAVYVVDSQGSNTPNKIADVADSSGSGVAMGGLLRWGNSITGGSKVGVIAGGSDGVLRLNVVDPGTFSSQRLDSLTGNDWSGFDWAPDGSRFTSGFRPSNASWGVYQMVPGPPSQANRWANGQAPAWGQAASPAAIDLEASRLEVTQAVQTTTNTVSLVRDKTTWVRFYVRSLSGDVNDVSARLVLTTGSQTKVLEPFNRQITVRADGGEAKEVDHTFNFLLPLKDWSQGTFTLRAEVIPPPNMVDSNPANNFYPRQQNPAQTVQFTTRGDLRIASWRFEVTRGTDVFSLTSTQAEGAAVHLRSSYPVSATAVALDDKGLIKVNRGDRSWNQFMIDLSGQIRTRCEDELPTGTDACVGWIPPGLYSSGYMGYAPGGFALATLVDRPHVFSHEIGHVLGRSHAEGCSADSPYDSGLPNFGRLTDVGFTGDNQAQRTFWGVADDPNRCTRNAQGYYDIMAYAGVNNGHQWVTAHTYNALYTRLAPASSPDQTLPDSNQSQTLAPYLTISGVISSTGQVRFYPINRDEQPVGSNDGPGAGPYRIELRSATGLVLFTRRFSAAGEAPGFASTWTSFYEIMPLPSGLASVVVSNQSGELGRLVASPNAPQVTVTEPVVGQTIGNPLQIRWTASDPDGNTLSYLVKFSPNGGQTWQVLAVDHATQSLSVDTSLWPATTQGVIRVWASDGVNSSSAQTSGFFSVPAKGPRVLILSPTDGATLKPWLSINAVGQAQDPEDGFLGDGAFTWQLNGVSVGTGRTLTLDPLVEGQYTLTLTAADSDGNRGSASISLRVNRYSWQFFLPVMHRNAR